MVVRVNETDFRNTLNSYVDVGPQFVDDVIDIVRKFPDNKFVLSTTATIVSNF